MAKYAFSIRKKITYGFSLQLLFMLCIVILTYGIVRQVDQKVTLVAFIDDFLYSALEIRRFEKNYLLYHQQKDFEQNLAYQQRLADLLNKNREEFRLFTTANALELLEEHIDNYRRTMDSLQLVYASANKQPRAEEMALEHQLRETGKGLTDFAEMVSSAERLSIKKLLDTTRRILLLSILVLVSLAAAITTLLGRRIVASLKLLELYTNRILKGEAKRLPMLPAETEIISLLRAFNRMAGELKMRQQQLLQSEKLAALGTLLSGVAHELNNPLSNISTSAQILDEELEGNDLLLKKNMLVQIEEQTDRARDIVRSLLEFSRNKTFNRQELTLKNLVHEIIVLVRGQVPTKVDIRIDIPEELTIIADKQRLQQVFINLIKNAVDAVAEDGHIWLSARRIADPPDSPHEMEILVEDDGPGIDPANLGRIFDPFFTTKEVGKGSGLGLFIVHDIIESHGGSIRVENRLGQGTTFIIWLPNTKEPML
ncbi:MAG: ATP-binding protein [Deltaproteobacteria bacterium]